MTFAGSDIGELSQLPLDQAGRGARAGGAGPVRRRASAAGAALQPRRSAQATPRAASPPAARRTQAAPDVRRTPNLSEEKRIAAQRIAHDVLERIADAAGAGPGLPVAGPQHADAVARRAAAPAPGHADPLQPVRRGLRAGRALGRPASGRRRGAAARRCDQLKARRQLAVRRRARPGRDAPRRLAGRRRPGRRRAGRPRALQRPAGGLARRSRRRTPRATCSRARSRRARRARAAARLAASCAASRATTCTASTRAFRSACFTAVTGVSGSGKSSLVSQALVELVGAHLGHEPDRRRRGRDTPCEPHGRAATARPHRTPAWSAIRRLVQRRPEADRPHAALQPGHLHRPVRPRAQAVRRHAGGAQRGATTPGRFSFNVAKGRCDNLRGRGLRQRRAAVHAQRLRAVPHLPRRALQRRRRCEVDWHGRNIAEVLAHDGRRGAARSSPTKPAVLRPLAAAAATSAWATCAWASRPPSCRAARRSASSWPPSCSARSAATRCTCWTSRPPACTPPTSTG